MLTMQEENNEDEFQKVYLKRIENEALLKQVLYDIEEVSLYQYIFCIIKIKIQETKQIHVIESNIRDFESDVGALKKFQKEMQVAICKIQLNIVILKYLNFLFINNIKFL